LIGLVHKINAWADRQVERELTEVLRRAAARELILFLLAGAAVEHPDDTVREAPFPVVTETTLRGLVREATANERLFLEQVRTELRRSYSSYYRRILPPLCWPRCDSGAATPRTGR
jgi:hypothetical protein